MSWSVDLGTHITTCMTYICVCVVLKILVNLVPRYQLEITHKSLVVSVKSTIWPTCTFYYCLVSLIKMNGKKCTQFCTCKQKSDTKMKLEKVGDKESNDKDKEFNPYCACFLRLCHGIKKTPVGM